MDKFKILKKQLKQLEKNKDLFPFLTIRLNSKAEFFFEAKSRTDLIKAYSLSKKLNLPFLILGGGSNLVPTEKKIAGLVVKNSYLKKEIVKESDSFTDLLISSGYPASLLVNQTIELGLSGFENFAGLPGTVGGAIYMNSKWTKPLTYFSDYLLFAYLIDREGKIKKVDRTYFKFNYDYSLLQKTKEILLEGVFRLKKTDQAELKKIAADNLKYRRQTQPLGKASSGCFFKNIAGQSTGYLIDKAGLKGYRVGRFMISEKHANFIINLGGGDQEDLLKLIKVIKSTIKEKFNLDLEEEVIII
ncbi:MAG: UDP-N-acetylmuramate dehydrogenase [Microgenomates group bacterium]|nr:UDP-N-acetylmuramate dehydrogenase [Microgenomates group bacterium]